MKPLDEEALKGLPEQVQDQIRKQKPRIAEVSAVHSKFRDGVKEGLATTDFFSEESDGTKKLFCIAGPFLESLTTGHVVVIDELDARLHPLLTKAIVRLFNSSVSNPNNAQLIFATHDTNLLDNDMLRRDQIWFTEKDAARRNRSLLIGGDEGAQRCGFRKELHCRTIRRNSFSRGFGSRFRWRPAMARPVKLTDTKKEWFRRSQLGRERSFETREELEALSDRLRRREERSQTTLRPSRQELPRNLVRAGNLRRRRQHVEPGRQGLGNQRQGASEAITRSIMSG